MRVSIVGEHAAKVQLFSSKLKNTLFGWLFRATYFEQKTGFAHSFDLPNSDVTYTVSIPGPVDVRLVTHEEGTQIGLTAQVMPDGSPMVLWEGTLPVQVGGSKDFEFTIAKGTYVRGTVSILP